jgi:tetratricopeptide (TPR) repeat protein
VDVERYLSSEPVTARPPTAAYRARKYVRKHRVMVAAATGISAALIVGAAATFWQAQKARQRLTEMQNVSQHLVARFHDLADQAGGMQTKKTLAELATVTLDDLSRESDLSIDERRQLADSYEALAQVQGDAYSSSIGDVLAARQSIHAAYLQRRLVYASDTTRVDYTNEMMKVSYLRASMHQGDYNVDGLAMLNRAIAMGERVLRAELHPTTMILMSTSLQLLAEYEYGLGHTSATLACLDEAMRLRRSLADTDPGNLEYRRLLADIEKTVSYVTDDDTLSLALARHALELNTGYSNARPFAWRGMMDLAYAHRNLAYALRRFGRHGAALDEMRACLAVREHMAAADTLDYRVRHFVADGWHLVGTAFADAGRPDSSLACHLRGLALYNEMEALPSQPFWLGYELSYSYEFLAEAYAAVGDTARARESYIEALARTDCNDPSNCLRKLRSIEGYSHFMDEIGDSLGSLRAHRECFDATFDALAARLADCHGSERAWGDVVAELCHLAEAFATSDPDLSGAAAEIATTYSMRELGAMHPLTARALAVKGSLQAHAGRLVESRRTYDELLAAQPECVLVCRPTAQIVTGNIRLLDDTLDDVTAKQFRFARVEAPGWSASHIPLIKRNRLWGMEPWPRVTALSRAPS